MSDIIFVLKYKKSYIIITVIQTLLNLMVMVFMTYGLYRIDDTYISDPATIRALIIILLGINLISILFNFSTQTRKLIISGNTMTLYTRIGIRLSKPYQPYAYFEKEKFIISGYIFGGYAFENMYELDWMFYNLAMSGRLNYIRERGIFRWRIQSLKTIIITIIYPLVCVGALIFAFKYKFIASPGFIIAFLSLIIFFMILFVRYKFVKADRKVWQQILNMFQAQTPGQY